MRLRLNPLYLLLLSLAALALTLAFGQRVETRRDELQHARTAFAQALTTARFELAAHTRRIATDRTLLQNLSWNLNHSVRGALEARLVHGKLDTALLVDEACQVVAQVHEAGAAAPDCPRFKGGGPLNTESFIWLRGKNGAVLTYTTPLVETQTSSPSRNLFLIGAVEINERWLGTQQPLKAQLAAVKLAMAEEAGARNIKQQAVIARDGITEEGVALAALVSESALDRQLIASLNKRSTLENPLLWPSLMLALVLTVIAAWRERSQLRASRDALQSFFDWCKTLLHQEGLSDSPPAGAGDPSGQKKRPHPLDECRAMIKRLIDEQKTATRLSRSKEQALEALCVSQHDGMVKLQARLAELAELDSLAVQLQRTTAGFLQRMAHLQTHVEHLSDLAMSGMTRDARQLSGILKDWRAGIAARGVRKFIRSLSETEGLQGSNRLEEQLLTMAELSSQLDDQAVNASLNCAGLSRESAYAARIAGFWHGLALKTHDEKPCSTLSAAVEEALGLVRLDRACAGVSFTGLITDAESSPKDHDKRSLPKGGHLNLDAALTPPLPQRALASALYHIYLATSGLVQHTQQALIASRLRVEGSKCLLIISASAQSGVPLPQRNDGQAYHLEIARAILAPFKLSVSALPVMKGPHPIAIAWPLPERQKPAPQRIEGATATGPRKSLAATSAPVARAAPSSRPNKSAGELTDR